MKRRVYWVDEDERIWATERNALVALGLEVVSIPDATSALALLQAEPSERVHLVILDVMLLPGEDEVRFSEEATGGGMETGLVLAQSLYAAKEELGKRILFFSRVTRADVVAKIRRVSEQLGASYLQKGVETQGKFFVTWLREHKFIGLESGDVET